MSLPQNIVRICSYFLIVVLMTNAIQQQRDELKKQEKQLRIDWKKLEEERQISKVIQNTDVIQLNVGGDIIITTRETLTKIPQSTLSLLFNGRWEDKLQKDKNENIFFDFNPILFRHLLDQLQIFEINHSSIIHPPLQSSLVEPFKKMLKRLDLHELLLSEEKNVITFNIGGRMITNQRTTFTPVSNSTFDTIVSPPSEAISDVFLDLDPEIFQHLIEQLRKGLFNNTLYSGLPFYQEKVFVEKLLVDLSIHQTIPAKLPSKQIFWSFDSNFSDLYDVYNGQGINGASFISPGYTGYGSALSLNGPQSQYVRVSKYLNMTYTSFTWELWAYPMNLVNRDNMMVSLCDSNSHDKCLYMSIRNSVTYFGFHYDDCTGSTNVNINQWHHFAFVYDYENRTQYIYLNGQLECTNNLSGPFLGNSGAVIIGASRTSFWTTLNSWTGYIDQVSYVSRAKTAIEILTDATLVAYYSFDNGSFYDSGPNKINGTGVNLSLIAGRINQGIAFIDSGAYFQANGFTLLGAPYRSYSIALWVYRFSTAIGSGTIVHLSAETSGRLRWCLPTLGLTSSGQIAAQSYNGGTVIGITGPIIPFESWTHVATSYSSISGLRLWVNGSLVSTSGRFNYFASGERNTITIGSSLAGTLTCYTGPIRKGQFYGSIDELRIYSRELNASDIDTLANP